MKDSIIKWMVKGIELGKVFGLALKEEVKDKLEHSRV